MTGVFEALGDATRRHVLEVLSAGEQAAGDVVTALQVHGPITQPGVSQHLRVLREAGLVTVRAEGTRRVYAVDVGQVSTRPVPGSRSWTRSPRSSSRWTPSPPRSPGGTAPDVIRIGRLGDQNV